MESQCLLPNNDSSNTITITFKHCSAIQIRIGNSEDIPHNSNQILLQILNDCKNSTLRGTWQNRECSQSQFEVIRQ